jgi:signal transduction histidine kinase
MKIPKLVNLKNYQHQFLNSKTYMMYSEKIYNSTLKFLSPLSLPDAYEQIAKEAIDLTGAKYGSIFMPEKGRMKRVYGSAPELYRVIPRKEGMTFQVYKTGKAMMRSSAILVKAHKAFTKMPIGTDISVPLTYKGTTVGVLSVLSFPDKQFSNDDLKLLELFAPLASLTIQKAQLHEDLEKALQSRDLFISLASHELRTPLTTIFMYTQILADMVAKGKIPPKEHLNKLLGEELRLKNLIDELLLIDNIKSGEFHFDMKECNLKDVILRAIDNFKLSGAKNPLAFKNELKAKVPMIMGDPDKLQQMIINLLNNAAKFSETDQRITISLNEEGDNLILKIKDNGIGIAKEDLPNIFQQFYKGKNTGKNGMGLGLFLVKHIVEKHQGKIAINSLLNKGTRFTISLPHAH